jgi:hypothetical protein
MPHDHDKFSIAVVSACMRADDGTPTFTLYEVEVTPDEYANGVHYSLVEAHLVADGFDEPYLHFDEREAPCFLFPSVREHLGLPVASR